MYWYSLKFGLGKCHPHWQTTFSNPLWHRLVSLTVVNTESDKVDSDTFGRLAALSSVNNNNLKDKNGQQTAPGSFAKFKFNENIYRFKENGRSTPLVESLENYQQENILDKWNRFKDAHYEELLKDSGNILQDDNEDDYYYFQKKNAKKKTVKSEDGNTSLNASLNENTNLRLEKENESQPEQISSDKFGTIAPPKLDHLNATGDEGDEREERYQEAKLERRHRPAYYGLRMKNLCKERKLLDALKILEEEMPAVAAKPDYFCYQVLINACGRAGYTKKAFHLYNQMKRCGFQIQPVAYTGLFNACANSPWPTTDGLKRATGLREQLLEKGYIFNQTITHAMIKAFGRCGDINTAFQIVDDMIEQGLLVTTETINFLLQACVTDKQTGFRHALMVWRKMRELKLSPDIYSYNLLIRSIKDCGSGDPQLTSRLLQEKVNASCKGAKEKMKQIVKENILVIESEIKKHDPVPGDASSTQDISGNVEISNSNSPVTSENVKDEKIYKLIEIKREIQNSTKEDLVLPNLLGRKITPGTVVGLGSLDQPHDRLALLGGPSGIFKQMERDRVKANLKSVTQLLDSLPASTEAEEALLQSMKNIGLSPDTQFCNMLIRKRNFRKDAGAAKDVLDIMQEHQLLPDIITFGCLALGCRNLEDAIGLLREMEAAEFRPNLEIMTILAKNSLLQQDYFFTLEMLKEMHQHNIEPDVNLLKLLESARTKARNTILQMEREKSSMKISKRKMEGIRIYLLEYKNWLKKSPIQLPDHPWAQYKAASSAVNST
ncbi:pentatricopeptide repeat-containing protein 1, mitochondrial [Procambarus clarkii]|uniref:pentatricopeptide repeat-containing protein 1, mitochondrial n=1 Tax=Procambarus clarkii TaxID=6728 RepID=UPI003741F59A